MATKAKKLGHLLLQTYIITISISWHSDIDSVTARYEKLDKIRHLAQSFNLLLQEEARPIAIALFSSPSLVFHLGFDQPNLVNSDWYHNCQNPYLEAITQILDNLVTWEEIKRLEFLIATGDDPMLGLQVKLDRKCYPITQQPSQLCGNLESQKIYSFE